MSRAPLRVAVVGAGLAGLTAAHAVRRHARERDVALELQVWEAGDVAGGQIHPRAEEGFLVEWAANAFRTGRGASLDLLTSLGLTAERVEARPEARRRFVLHGGRLHRLPSGPASVLSFAPLSRTGRWRVLAEPFLASRVDHEESVHDFAARHLGAEAADVLLGTMVRGVYGGDARRLSVDAAFPVMREMERDHRSLVIAGVAGAGKRKREGKTTWSFRAGMSTLMDALAADLGAAVRTRAAVESVDRGEAGTGFRVRLATGEVRAFGRLVLAVPPRVASRWLRSLDPAAADEIAAIEAADIAMVALALPLAAFRTAPEGYGFLVAPGQAPDAAPDVLGALFESNVFPGRAPAGHVLVRVIMGGAGRSDVLARSDDALTATAVDAMDRAVGLTGAPSRVWVHRQPAAIPQYLVGHGERVARIAERLRGLPGLSLAGSAYRGIAVGAIVADADVVAAEALADGASPSQAPACDMIGRT
jgi:protoporphyrinogen/coproporphyrinogen III oxidase